MSLLFEFESDLYPSLHCIPMAIRYKLDVVGIKVSLRAWNQLAPERRLELLHAWSVDTPGDRDALRQALRDWLRAASDEPLRCFSLDAPPWQDTARLCPAIAEESNRCEPALSLQEWTSLELLERFALFKLATAKHERGRFAGALAEFRRRRARNEQFTAAQYSGNGVPVSSS